MDDKPIGCPWCGNTPTAFEEFGELDNGAFPIYSLTCTNGVCPVRPSLHFVSSTEEAVKKWNHQTSFMLQVPVQVNGKLVDMIFVSPSSTPEDTEYAALTAPNARDVLAMEKIKRVIIVPGKLVNVVTWPTPDREAK